MTQLTDLVFGEDYNGYARERAVQKNAFIQSGVAVMDPQLDALAAGQGSIHNLPHFKPISFNDPNISNDNSGQNATPGKITSGNEKVREHLYNQSWTSADVTTALISADPLTAIADMTALYWATWNQRMVVSSALGILADNIANDSGDMVINVAAESTAADRKMSSNALVDALQTMGDHKSKIRAIGVHSVTHAQLQKEGLLNPHYDPETSELLFEEIAGKRVIMDDALPAQLEDVGGTDYMVYTSILFAEGAFALGSGVPRVPAETDRSPLAGNGGGIETLAERRHLLVHPRGYAWTDASVAAATGATRAELESATNWDRVYDRKNVGLAFIKTRND